MVKKKIDMTEKMKIIPHALQLFLNLCLLLFALVLSFLLVKEIVNFLHLLIANDNNDYKLILANILVFFLYFEFITMIVKYFKEDFHFPLRYFIYIGITAMLRLIIIEHEKPIDTLIYALVILILIIGYFIINITPRERPKHPWTMKKKDSISIKKDDI
ncbi:phosphate-starvation-inducible protein PsiE [Lysinibacillus fusiformis]|uniref:phosphate-starvation-inducible protein PsiE n=1 Tax=Lysinibacillus TaxID=400634 RepID=UPI0028E314B3|nr:phosphate-starvation-inducible protein PsiE [Lysinibacillus capsici]MED4551232.1 phosphate-starvation-inducible protein PsiE [Lysinibacillus capsici]